MLIIHFLPHKFCFLYSNEFREVRLSEKSSAVIRYSIKVPATLVPVTRLQKSVPHNTGFGSCFYWTLVRRPFRLIKKLTLLNLLSSIKASFKVNQTNRSHTEHSSINIIINNTLNGQYRYSTINDYITPQRTCKRNLFS